MGTETENKTAYSLNNFKIFVKLNNPLMGTETVENFIT